jgi:hypothetical protein
MGQAAGGRVHALYLVSSDRQIDAKYTDAIWKAIVDVRWWYHQQLKGPTFRLLSGVEFARSPQRASWFTTNANGAVDDYHYNNALQEAGRLVGARQNDPANLWVIYSDAPGDKGRGTAGVCVLPGDDLLGLTGQHPTQKNKSRWVGGLAHELGHALGLPHPADTTKDQNSIMWAGFYEHYPNGAYLTPDAKAILLTSPFIGR